MRPSFLPGLLVLFAGACASPSKVAPAAPREESVRPGVNERFLSADLDVEEFVRTFEGESREIARNRDAIYAALAVRPGQTVADIGAGTGLFLEPLARGVGQHGRVIALDISPRFIAHLEQRVRDEGWSQAEVVQCKEDSVGLPERSLDLALVCDTYHHFEFPQSTLASLRAALRPGGRLVVVDFERIPGVSREWTLDHVRADKATFQAEIEAAGFRFEDEVEVDGLLENYVLRFRRP